MIQVLIADLQLNGEQILSLSQYVQTLFNVDMTGRDILSIKPQNQSHGKRANLKILYHP